MELSSGRGETAGRCGKAPKEREPGLTSSTSLPGSLHGPLQPLQSTRVAAQAVAGVAATRSLESTPDRNSMSPGSLAISLQHYHFTRMLTATLPQTGANLYTSWEVEK